MTTANPITADRHQLAGELVDLLALADLDQWHVYPDPPAGITTPSLVLIPTDPWGRYTYDSWSVPVEVWAFAEQLDLAQLDQVLAVLLLGVPSAEVRQAPALQRYGGSSYLGATVVAPRHVNLAPPPPA